MHTPDHTPDHDSPAAAEYAARRLEIARLLDVLNLELDAHQERAGDRPRDRGFAAELAHLRGSLIDAVAAISGKDRAEVERFLRDAE